MSTGRTYGEQRYSPLQKINQKNADQLGLAWSYKLDVDRATEGTPIVVDGVMYVTGAYSIVSALDPRDGHELWKFDPKVRSEEHTSELQSLMRISYAVFCLKKKNKRE